MSRRMIQAGWVIVALGGFSSQAAFAENQNWAERMFTESGHNFGPVPRGAVVRHNFKMTNLYNEPLTILDVRASCGCTSGRATATEVNPGQTIDIEAQMDTRNFTGQKATKLTVSFLTPSGKSAEVQLVVVSNILADIVLNPGTIDFGTVGKGQTPKIVMTIERVGAPDWKFEKMVASPKLMQTIQARIDQVERSSSRVVYQLTVSLKPGAPSGYLSDEIRILTNDPSSPNVPVMVTAQIQGAITATPAILNMGRATGNLASGRYVVRGAKPFAIKSIEGAGDGFSISADSTQSKVMHILTIAYNRNEGRMLGDLRRSFRIVTDQADEAPVEVSATLRVDP